MNRDLIILGLYAWCFYIGWRITDGVKWLWRKVFR